MTATLGQQLLAILRDPVGADAWEHDGAHTLGGGMDVLALTHVDSLMDDDGETVICDEKRVVTLKHYPAPPPCGYCGAKIRRTMKESRHHWSARRYCSAEHGHLSQLKSREERVVILANGGAHVVKAGAHEERMKTRTFGKCCYCGAESFNHGAGGAYREICSGHDCRLIRQTAMRINESITRHARTLKKQEERRRA